MQGVFGVNEVSRSRKIRYCLCTKFIPTLSGDLAFYWQGHAMDMVFNLITAVWMITNLVLFGVAVTKNNHNAWVALGIISTIIPWCLIAILFVGTIVLYCKKVYGMSGDDLFHEANPDIFGNDSFRIDHSIHFSQEQISDSKIIRI